MTVFTIISTTGPWQVLARSVSDARLMAKELEPHATVIRIERLTDW